MRRKWNVIIVGIAAGTVAACGGSSKTEGTTPVDHAAGHHAAEASAEPAAEGHDSHAASGEHGGHCGMHAGHQADSHQPASDEAEPSDVKAHGEAQVGDKTTCPVSGKEFTVSEEHASVVHEGKTYYFCCPGCDSRFKADPTKYVTR